MSGGTHIHHPLRELHNKAWQAKYAHLLVIALVTTFLTSNILAYKYVELFGIKFGAAAALFPFSLIIGDALSEVYGFRRTCNAILISLVCYFFFAAIAQFTVWLPPAPEWGLQEQYAKFFATTWRVFMATTLAFLVSQLVNAYVLVWMKNRMHGRSFYIRAMASTVVGELAHTLVVAPLLFGGILTLTKLGDLIITATSIKIVVEAIILPLTIWVISFLKDAEGVEYYDEAFVDEVRK